MPGTNSRLDEVQAAILRVGLRHLRAWNERRRALAALYDAELAGGGLRLPREQPWGPPVWHLYVVRHPRRDALRRGAEAARRRARSSTIRSRCTCRRRSPPWGGRRGDFPVAESGRDEVLSLPLYPEMSDEEARQVAAAVRAALAEM